MEPMEPEESQATSQPILAVLAAWECVFTEGRLVRVPHDLERLHLGPEDVAMELRGKYRYWEVREFTSDEERRYWWTGSRGEWSFFHPIPVYLVILFVSDDEKVVNSLSVVPQNSGDPDVLALGIWIESDEDLDLFVDLFYLDLLDEQPDGMAESYAQALVDEAFTAKFPTPLDYVVRYWEKVPVGDRKALLTEILWSDLLADADLTEVQRTVTAIKAKSPRHE